MTAYTVRQPRAKGTKQMQSLRFKDQPATMSSSRIGPLHLPPPNFFSGGNSELPKAKISVIRAFTNSDGGLNLAYRKRRAETFS